MPVSFKDIFDQLKKAVEDLATSTLKNYIKGAKTDGQNMLNAMKEKLQRWTGLLIDGKLTTEDFEWLVNSQKDLVEMAALKQAGLAAIRIDQFKASLLNVIVDTVFSMIKI
jgi:uncharacterized NAD(P)/FAD-binding protein YdhS